VLDDNVGDAVIVYWKSETAINMQDSSEDIERGELVYKASHCCLELLTKLGTYDINIADCATKTLRIHLGIGAGLVTDVVVGGNPGRWEHFIAGDGVNQLSQVLDLAKAGELALSHQALKWLVYVVDIRTLNLGDYDKRCIILTGLAKAERRVPPPQEKEETFPLVYDKQKDDNMALYKHFMDRTALFKLQSDVNQSNLFQLDSGLLELLNLTELRQITTIFIKIGSLQGAQREELLQQSQDAIQVVQNALQRCDGSLRQFHVDDKGAVILCFFGLPPLAHENDSKLGISAGIEIREKFVDMFEEFSIGITTGVVSFGGVGVKGRAEYAVVRSSNVDG
jgi:class 3 adenylate cyclase